MPGRPKAIPQHGHVSSFLLCEALFAFVDFAPNRGEAQLRVIRELPATPVGAHKTVPDQFALLVGRQGTDEVSQFSLKHQGEKIAANRALLRKALVTPDDDLGSKDRKSTRLNSSHVRISYAVFCLKKKKKKYKKYYNQDK